MPFPPHFVIVALGLFVSSGAAGCAPTVTVPPAAQPTVPTTPQVRIEPLTADQLAEILGVNVWTATYSGGPIECWLEIEEEGQSTLPKRIPEKDFLGAGWSELKGENEGTIDFWWTRREDGQGGQLTIRKTGSTYGYGLNKDAFTFAWQGSFSASSTPKGKIKLMNSLPPGREFVIVDYDARESQRDGEK